MTRKRSRRLLSLCCACLLKSFSAVTFTDLQKASGVGRSTIYRLFDTTADILAYGCDSFAEKVNDRYKDLTKNEEPSKRDVALFVFESLSSEHELLNAIMESRREDLLARSMQKCNHYLVEEDEDVKVKYRGPANICTKSHNKEQNPLIPCHKSHNKA